LWQTLGAHDFKVGDKWYFSFAGGSRDAKVIIADEGGAIFLAKENKQSFAITISFINSSTIDLYFPDEKKIEMNLLSNGYYSPKSRKSTSIILSKNKLSKEEVSDLGKLFLNKHLSLKDGSILYLPLPTNWKPKYMKNKTNFLKFDIYNCDKLKGVCKGTSDIGDDIVFLTISISNRDFKNKVSRGITVSLEFDDEKYYKHYEYEASYYPAISSKLIRNAKLPSSFIGKVFTYSLGRGDLPMEIFFDVKEEEIVRLLSKK